MNEIRGILATVLFSVCCYLIYDLIMSGFSIGVLVGVVIIYVASYLIWPNKRDRKGDGFDPFDALEIIIEMPYRAISLLFRSFSRSKSDRGGTDIDFDI